MIGSSAFSCLVALGLAGLPLITGHTDNLGCSYFRGAGLTYAPPHLPPRPGDSAVICCCLPALALMLPILKALLIIIICLECCRSIYHTILSLEKYFESLLLSPISNKQTKARKRIKQFSQGHIVKSTIDSLTLVIQSKDRRSFCYNMVPPRF